jgi:hypothetical protein
MLVEAMLAALTLAVAPADPAASPAQAAAAPASATSTASASPTATPTATATATPTPTTAATPTTTETETPPATDAPGATDLPPEAPAAALPAAPPGPPLADAGPLLLARVERSRGLALERLVEPSGDVVEHEVNAAGTVQSCRKVGSLLALRVVAQQPAAGGEYVQVARDASGALVRYVVDADGEPRAVALLAPAP